MQHSKFHEFEDMEVKGDVLTIRESFAGAAIIDAWNYAGGSGSIELSREDALGVIEALVDVAQLDVFELIERLTGATVDV